MRLRMPPSLRPFSHRPGTKVVLPGSPLQFAIFPSFIEMINLETQEKQEVELPIHGPVRDFTVFCDLDRGEILVIQTTKKGLMRYRITQGGLIQERGEERIRLSYPHTNVIAPKIALFLGENKAQDFDLMRRRLKLAEIFPHWLRAGLWAASYEGERLKIDSFEDFFLLYFGGILAPRSEDEDHLGGLPFKGTPLSLLAASASAILSLFVHQEGSEVHLLPHLMPQFHCGRLFNVATESANLYFEWTKKSLFRVRLQPTKAGNLTLHFPKRIGRCRIREKRMIFKNGETLFFERKELITLDRFEH